LLESEQNSSVALRKELQDLEKKVETLQGNNNTLEKKVRRCTHMWGPHHHHHHHHHHPNIASPK
jgi:hypothetical protein